MARRKPHPKPKGMASLKSNKTAKNKSGIPTVSFKRKKKVI